MDNINNQMSLRLIQKNKNTIPVDVDQLKLYLRIDGNDDNEILKQMINSTSSSIEAFLNKKLIKQTWEMSINFGYAISNKDNISIPYAPLAKIESIKIGDTSISFDLIDGNKIKLKLDDYIVAAHSSSEKLKIVFCVGYGDSYKDIPDTIKQAIYMMVGDLYENRIKDTSTPIDFPVMSKRVRELLEPLTKEKSTNNKFGKII